MGNNKKHRIRRLTEEELIETVAMNVRWLMDLRRETDPELGESSAKEKDRAAFMALHYASDLVHHLAGWAINHYLGLAAQGLSPVPETTSTTREHPEYLEARSKADTHEHEYTGFALRNDPEGLPPDVARLLFLSLLRANPGAFPIDLTTMAIDALEALEFNMVLPLLEPSKEHRKVGLYEHRLMLEALGYVHYRVGRGKVKYRAEQEVADAYGVDITTLRKWKPRLLKEIGSLAVENVIAIAEKFAVNEEKEIRQLNRGEPAALGLWDFPYSDEALHRAAAKYKAARGFGSK